jgi:hypothetical protein
MGFVYIAERRYLWNLLAGQAQPKIESLIADSLWHYIGSRLAFPRNGPRNET